MEETETKNRFFHTPANPLGKKINEISGTINIQKDIMKWLLGQLVMAKEIIQILEDKVLERQVLWPRDVENKEHWDMIASFSKSFKKWERWEKELEDLRAIIGIEEEKKNLLKEIDAIHQN